MYNEKTQQQLQLFFFRRLNDVGLRRLRPQLVRSDQDPVRLQDRDLLVVTQEHLGHLKALEQHLDIGAPLELGGSSSLLAVVVVVV